MTVLNLLRLFDYQRFERNPELVRIAHSAEKRNAVRLTDEELSYVSAAGEDPNQSKAELWNRIREAVNEKDT